MLDELLQILLVGLAAGYMIRAWLRGSIFAAPRSWIEDNQLERFLPEWLAVKLQMLLTCPLCLAPWTALACLVFLQVAANCSFSALIALKALAAAAIAVIIYPLMETE